MRGLSRAGITLAVVIGLLAPIPAALGQGVDFFFPPPITIEELDEYASMIGLSAEQRRAVEPMVEGYRRGWAQVRQGDIAGFLADYEATRQRWLKGSAGPEVVQAQLRRIRDLRATLAALDEGLFAQVEPLLAEVQKDGLGRARRLRERRRHTASILYRLNGLDRIDLTQLLGPIDLTPAEREAVEPVVGEYELAFGAALRAYADQVLETWLFPAQGNEEFIQEQTELFLVGVRLSAINRRAVDEIVPLLTDEHARAFRLAWQRRAYAGIAPDPESAAPILNESLDAEDLNGAERRRIAELRDRYVADHDRLNGRIIELIDAARQQIAFWFRPNNEPPPEEVEAVRALLKSREELNAGALTMLAELLGAERIESIAASIEKPPADGPRMWLPRQWPRPLIVFVDNVSFGGSSMGSSPVRAIVSFRSMSEPELQRYADELGLSEAQRAAAAELYADYAERFGERFQARSETRKDAGPGCWITNDRGEFVLPTVQQLESDQRSLRRWISELQDIDESFFAELERSVLRPGQSSMLPALRRERRRAGYLQSRGPNLELNGVGFADGWSALHQLDLTSLLAGLKAHEDEEEQFASIRDAYDAAATELVRQRVDAVLDCELLANILLIESFREGEKYYECNLMSEGDVGGEFRSACRRYADARRQYDRLNRATCRQMMELLTPQSARRLDARYRQAAYPSLVEDSDALHEKLEQAQQLGGLAEEQQVAIYELRHEYERQYRAITDGMVAAQDALDGLPPFRIADSGRIEHRKSREGSEAREQVRRLRALQFERAELNAVVRRRLAEILPEEQRRALGIDSIPEPTPGAR